MGLLFRPRRPVARLAAGAATAGIAYRSGQRRAEQDAYQRAEYEREAVTRYQAQQAQAAPPPAPGAAAAPAAAAVPDPRLGELERLAQMHGSGDLSDAEFAAAKASILGIVEGGGR